MKKLMIIIAIFTAATSRAQMSQSFECVPYSGTYSTSKWSLVISDPDLPSFYLTSPDKITAQGSMGVEALMDYNKQCQKIKLPYRLSVNAYPFRGDFCCKEK